VGPICPCTGCNTRLLGVKRNHGGRYKSRTCDLRDVLQEKLDSYLNSLLLRGLFQAHIEKVSQYLSGLVNK